MQREGRLRLMKEASFVNLIWVERTGDRVVNRDWPRYRGLYPDTMRSLLKPVNVAWLSMEVSQIYSSMQ